MNKTKEIAPNTKELTLEDLEGVIGGVVASGSERCRTSSEDGCGNRSTCHSEHKSL